MMIKKIWSVNSIETYAYGATKDIISLKGKAKSSNIIKQCKK